MPIKRVIIAAGGTGGHVIPALEVAGVLRARGWECAFVGTPKGFENRLVPQAGFELYHVPIGSLNRVSMRRRLETLLSAPCALAVMLALVRRLQPLAALSLGGYSSGPLVVASALLDLPLVVMEPNARAGLANRLAAPAARLALLSHGQTASYFRSGTCFLTGMPVRGEFFRTAPRPKGSPFTILILGGSQGAARLNRAAVDAARTWQAQSARPPRLVHQTGERDHATVAAAYAEIGIEVETAVFFDDMPERFAQADLVICRAGASVIAELCAACKPCVLVPLPHAADDHQRANGTALAKAGGAVLVEDTEWTGQRMVSEIASLQADSGRLDAMAKALAPLARGQAARDAADAVVAAARAAGRIQ